MLLILEIKEWSFLIILKELDLEHWSVVQMMISKKNYFNILKAGEKFNFNIIFDHWFSKFMLSSFGHKYR